MQTSMDLSVTRPDRAGSAGENAPEATGGDFPWPSLALFPERLNYALDRARLKPGELAIAVNASRKVISNMRTRQQRCYGGPYLQAIASVLDAPADWLGSNTAPGEAVSRLWRERHDAVEDLAAVVMRLLERNLISQSEIVALTSMMRIRETEARHRDVAAPVPGAPPAVDTRRPGEQVVRWPQPGVTRLMAVAGRDEVADAA